MSRRSAGLRLEQDAPVLFCDFRDVVLPAVERELGSGHEMTPLGNGGGGGFFISRHPVHGSCGDAMRLEFCFSNWAVDCGDDHALVAHVHHLEFFGTPPHTWTIDEIEATNKALVVSLQWWVLQSKGMKLARRHHLLGKAAPLSETPRRLALYS